jgi:hypothetical protein
MATMSKLRVWAGGKGEVVEMRDGRAEDEVAASVCSGTEEWRRRLEGGRERARSAASVNTVRMCWPAATRCCPAVVTREARALSWMACN